MINQYYSHKQLKYSLYNGIKDTYFGMLSYIMLNMITNKPIRPVNPVSPRKPRKPSKRISARQVQNNLDAFIKEQRQTNKILLEFVNETRQFMLEQREFNDEQRKFNKLVLTRFDKVDTRIDNLVSKNNLVE